MRNLLRQLLFATALSGATMANATDTKFDSPTILVLGDSQISFGSGPVFLDFFENIRTHCPPTPRQARAIDAVADGKVAVIGVRSTSLPSWTARSGPAKGAICKVDPKWKVNAGTYGFINTTGNKYKQMGQGRNYQFCASGKSAFETMLRPKYYEPKLIFMNFLGNSAKKWANSYGDTLRDVKRMNSQLPQGVPCVFMTTAPSYSKKITDLRVKAQANLERAFEESGSQCSFVKGFTPDTIAANQGNPRHFRRHASGKVKDPFHPNARGATKFFSLERTNICNAVYEQLERTTRRTVAVAPPFSR